MSMVAESIEIKASPKQCFEVITDYEAYPEFLSDLKDVTVANKKGNTCDVTYEIEVIKRIQYTLKMKAAPLKIEWSFIKGDIMKDNHGYWELEEVKKGLTKATYHIEVRFGLLVPSAVTKSLVSKNLPAMLNNFKARIEKRAKAK
jgi:coenzyme Q-binding protein COQ10